MTSLLDVQGALKAGRFGPADLRVPAGQLVAIIGPNGGGKTSLLRACAAIEGTAGTVRVEEEDLRTSAPARRQRLLGYLPASREMVWPIGVRDLVSLGLTSPDPERVEALLGLLELEPIADRPVDRLSTGERARVLLARALAPQPRVLVLDEPLSNLDPYWVLRLLQLLRGIANDGAAVLVALHDIERVDAFDRVLLVSEGEIRADLAPRSMMSAPELSRAFRIERGSGGWELRPPEDRQSWP
jgi:iron complex transport system ATP-binding protein